MFTVLDRALFRPVDLPHLDELVFIQGAATPPAATSWRGGAKPGRWPVWLPTRRGAQT